MFKITSSFDSIEITGFSPLVICDIDETLITFANGIEFCNELAKQTLSNTDDFDYIYKLYKSIKPPVQTDPDGFGRLVSRLEQTNGKLMFLTARSESASEKTKNILNKLD